MSIFLNVYVDTVMRENVTWCDTIGELLDKLKLGRDNHVVMLGGTYIIRDVMEKIPKDGSAIAIFKVKNFLI